MPRGGKRQGTPGQGYAERTDLNLDHAPSGPTADGGIATPATGGYSAPPAPPPQRGPDDTPSLTTPTLRPDEPITAGLPMGAGAGPDDPSKDDWESVKTMLPDFKEVLRWPDTSSTFKTLVSYLENR